MSKLNHLYRLGAFAALGSCLVACDAPSPPAPRAEPRESPPVAEAVEPPQPAGDPPHVGPAGTEKVALAAVWPPASEIDAATVARLPRRATDAIALASLPVLMPRAEPQHLERALVASLLPTAIVLHQASWTSVSLRGQGLTITLTATSLAHRHAAASASEPVALPHELRGKPALVTQNEGIWSATWFEHGVSYAAEIECDRPDAKACAGPDLVRALAEDLVFVGGKGAAK